MALKPISSDRSVQIVWYGDPAVDADSSAPLSEYIEACYANPASWQDMLKFKDGMEPSKFSIGVIPSGELASIEDECRWGRADASIHRMQWLCFLHCVRGITDFPGVQVMERGRSVTRLPTKDVGGVEYVDSAWLAETFTGPLRQCAQFVGAVAYRWNQLSEDDAKNS